MFLITKMATFGTGSIQKSVHNPSLTNEEINELMRALGFHRIDSRDRWKMKLVDKIEITDASIRDANMNDKLAEFLSANLEKGFQSLKTLQTRKRMLTAFFKT